MGLEPLEQRAGHVQRQRNEAGLTRAFDDRPVDVTDMIGHDVVEIPDWLMQVQAKDKPQRLVHEGIGCSSWRKTSAALPAAGSLLRASPNFSMNPASSRPLSAPASVMACAA